MPIPSPHGWARMTITLLRSQPALLLVVVLLLGPVGRVTGQGGSRSPAQVLQDLLARYGDNSTITVPQLRSLLATLSQGQSENIQDVNHAAQTTTATPPKTNSSKCLPADTLAIYSISEQSRLDEQGLQKLCPTMLQQLDAGSCKGRKEEEPSPDPSPRPTDAEVWGYGILCVTLISLCSLIGASVVPFMRKTFYKRLLLYFIALAIGTLYSNALFQLIPEVTCCCCGSHRLRETAE
uniref:Solute carrier family 39 (Zinc transporter), member 14 n=1 Tax=Iconisemion striatum TaxID=60296 RepID=A0A1A7WQH1_9TELE